MKEIVVTSIGEYIDLFDSLEDTEFYRGIADSTHNLIPRVGRFDISELKRQVEFEKMLFDDFKLKSPMFLSDKPSTDLEWLCLAQHHGIPTRLMDWTFNPLVALFFAVENNVEKDGAVYCAFPSSGYEPKELLKCNDGVFNTSLNLIHIVPSRTHTRYQNQDGLFTFHPDPRKNKIKNIVKKITISFKDKDSMKWRLRKMGITKRFIYADLDGLSYDILESNKRKLQLK
ncbi:MAG: FRG domain-containing protein [Colwellia sp.]